MRQAGDAVYAIAWEQVVLEDDPPGCAPDVLCRGAALRWDGPVRRLHRRAPTLMLQRVARAGAPAPLRDEGSGAEADAHLPRGGMILTDGLSAFRVLPVRRSSVGWLLAFLGAPPPRRRSLWVVRRGERGLARRRSVVGLTSGTPLDTDRGAVAVGALRPGDRLRLLDGSWQPVLRVVERPLTGGDLYVAPDARPLWIEPAALGVDAPPLRVAPDQAIGLSGPAVSAIFPRTPVTVTARDLLDCGAAQPDLAATGAELCTPVLARPGLVQAGGVALEAACAEPAPWRRLNPAEAAILGDALRRQSRTSSRPTPQRPALSAQPR